MILRRAVVVGRSARQGGHTRFSDTFAHVDVYEFVVPEAGGGKVAESEANRGQHHRGDKCPFPSGDGGCWFDVVRLHTHTYNSEARCW